MKQFRCSRCGSVTQFDDRHGSYESQALSSGGRIDRGCVYWCRPGCFPSTQAQIDRAASAAFSLERNRSLDTDHTMIATNRGAR